MSIKWASGWNSPRLPGQVFASKDLLAKALKSAKKGKGWEDSPKGWDKKSKRKYWNSWKDKNPEHPTTECINEMKGKVDNPGAFCASLRDEVEGSTDWRGEE